MIKGMYNGFWYKVEGRISFYGGWEWVNNKVFVDVF